MAKLPDALYKLLLRQGHIELTNSFYYLQMCYWASDKHFPGTSAYFKYQYEEETSHALTFFNFVDKRSHFVQLDALEPLKTNFTSAVDIFQLYFERESANAEHINQLAIEAQKHQDWSTVSFLKNFLDDQISEVAQAEEFLVKAKAYSSTPGLFYEFDKELKSYIPSNGLTISNHLKPASQD